MNQVLRDIPRRRSAVSADPASSPTLPAWAYTDPAIFAREKEEIFFKSWQYAGTIHSLRQPGDYITANLLGQSVIVLRDHNGELRGFHNVCQHRAHQLLSGRGHVRAITCPYHAWAYGTDGRLLAARGTQKLGDFVAAQYSLKPVRIEVFAQHFVFFNLDPEATPLAEQTGSLAADMRRSILGYDDFDYCGPMTTIPGDVKANWKVLVDNYLECYHCRPAHPALADLLDMKFSSWVHGNWTHQKSALGRHDNTAYCVSPEEENTRALFWWVFPNTTFNVSPGDPSQVQVVVFQPMGLDRTYAWSDLLAPRGTAENLARTAYQSNVVGPEDNALCESVQRGLESKGYEAGRIVYDPSGGEVTEELVHNFHRKLTETLSL